MSASTSTAPPPPQPQILLFARAVLAILDCWPALTIAVKEEWGGPESGEKKTWIASTLIDEFEARAEWVKVEVGERAGAGANGEKSKGKSANPSTSSLSTSSSSLVPTLIIDPKSTDHPLDFDELADLLSQMLSDEFDANLEDGSIDSVSRDIGIIWDVIAQRSTEEATTRVEALEKKAEEKKGKSVQGTKKGLIGEDGEELDDDSDESGSEEEEDGGMEVDEVPQLVPREKERVEKVVDEDGFELVQKGSKRK